MAEIVLLPKEGITVESCLIGAWHKDIGDPVSQNDVLFDYETDKASFECVSTAAGTLLHKFYQEGDEAPVLTPAAIIGEKGEDISSLMEVAPEGDDSPAEPEFDSGGDRTESMNVSEAKQEDAEVRQEGAEPPMESGAASAVASSETIPSTTDYDDLEIVYADGMEGESDEAVQEETAAADEPPDEVKISPRARSLAEKLGVELNKVVPTGPNGRILEADVKAAAAAAPEPEAEAAPEPEAEAAPEPAAEAAPEPEAEAAPEPEAEAAPEPKAEAAPEPEAEAAPEPKAEAAPEPKAEAAPEPKAEAAPEPEVEAAAVAPYVDIAFTKIRSVIAKTMTASLQRSAQVTHNHSFDATSVLAMREDFKSSDEALGYKNVSVGDIVLYVVSRRLAMHPEINALVADRGTRRYNIVNLGVAVDTERGLIVPTIFNAEKKSIKEISKEIRELAFAAREARISPDYLQGGTFTVSNLGATGVESFSPIINPPQAAILGVCGIVERVKKGENGQPVVYPSIGLSFTYDHRAVDGAPASRFVAELCADLASFSWKTLALEAENR